MQGSKQREMAAGSGRQSDIRACRRDSARARTQSRLWTGERSRQVLLGKGERPGQHAGWAACGLLVEGRWRGVSVGL